MGLKYFNFSLIRRIFFRKYIVERINFIKDLTSFSIKEQLILRKGPKQGFELDSWLN